jgi:FTR1 family protein
MLESFAVVLRDAVEAVLVLCITLAILKCIQRGELKRSVFWGLGLAILAGIGLAILASIGMAVALNIMSIDEVCMYDGVLFWVSAVFVASMMWWFHRKSKATGAALERDLKPGIAAASAGRGSKEAWALGAFAFLLVFRECARAVMLLSTVNLTTDAMLSFIGSVLGLAAVVTFGVLFVRGSLHVNPRRFFVVTRWVLGIFVVQLFINGFHEFAETGVIPVTQKTMALVGPIVRNDLFFPLVMIAITLFIWLGKSAYLTRTVGATSAAENRLLEARARRVRVSRYSAVASVLSVLVVVGIVYARELMPKEVPPPESASLQGEMVVVPLVKLDDGKLHRFGFPTGGLLVRFLAIRTSDGKYRTALDACEICGPVGYIQEGEQLLCLNCMAEINPFTVGVPGGCNPIPLQAEISSTQLRVHLALLEKMAFYFVDKNNSL